jgi:hypothetical protein
VSALAWAQFPAKLWTDEAVRELSADAKLLFIWSWTNPQSNMAGLYQVSVRSMQRALQEKPIADEERVIAALDELARKPLALYDYDNEVIWVVNRAKHANRSPKCVTAIQRHVGLIYDSPLKAQFTKRYKALLTDGKIEGRDPVDTKKLARSRVRKAIESGLLVRPDECELANDACSGRIEAHHPDYSKPLEVRWLCIKHHREVMAR